MKNLIKALLLICALSTTAFAQDDISQSTGIIGNGRLLGAKTYDGQLTVGILGIDSSGNTVIKALSGKTVSIPGTMSFTGNATLAANLVFSAASAKIIPGATSLLVRNNADSASNISILDSGAITLAMQNQTISKQTSDASDNGTLQISAGGAVAFDGTRGGTFYMSGNESGGGVGGQVQTYGGAVSTGHIRNILKHTSATFTVEGSTGTLTATDGGKLSSSATSDFGWALVSAANQACNTTCVSACIMGQETTSKAFLACTDATADICLCAGAS